MILYVFILYNHSLLAFSESHHLPVVTRPVTSNGCTFYLGENLEFIYLFQISVRGYALKKKNQYYRNVCLILPR